MNSARNFSFGSFSFCLKISQIPIAGSTKRSSAQKRTFLNENSLLQCYNNQQKKLYQSISSLNLDENTVVKPPCNALTLAVVNAKLWTPFHSSRDVPSNLATQNILHKSHFLTNNALGVTNNKITMIGSSQQILAACDENTNIVDAKDTGMLIPGFTDSHCHFLDGGYRLLGVQLRKCRSKEEVMNALDKFIVENKPAPGTWILGGDWDHWNWGGVLPDRTWIDSVSPHNPVWLNRLDGHMFLANSLALKLANVDKNTGDVVGGTIVRFGDETQDARNDASCGSNVGGGKKSENSNSDIYAEKDSPTGVLKDAAANLVKDILPPYTKEESRKALEAAMDYVAERGVTKVHTMVTVDCSCGLWPKNLGKDADKQDVELAFEELSLYQEFERKNKLRTRIRAALPIASWQRLMKDVMGKKPEVWDTMKVRINNSPPATVHNLGTVVKNSSADSMLQVGVLKAMIDGSLGTRTAKFYEDYLDAPGYNGDFIWDHDLLQKNILDASANGLQVCVHAIGDHANQVQLDLFENVKNEFKNQCCDVDNNSGANFGQCTRFRIEHAQHITPKDIPRFGELDVIASMQMSHLSDDGRWAVELIGKERMKTSWPMKSLLDHGAVVALGSDWFVSHHIRSY